MNRAPKDELAAARGVKNALLLIAPFWGLIGLAWWLL